MNQQGHKLVNFCNDVDFCIINGRVEPNMDDFTSLTCYRGKAVVDYHLTRMCNLDNIKKFNVISCVDLVRDLHLELLLGDNCHIPDHNLLTMSIEMSNIIRMTYR